MRSEWVNDDVLGHILAALTEPNRLACAVSIATGLRIGDVLSLKTEQLQRSARVTVREQKTGKSRRVYFGDELRAQLLRQAGRVWVFEGRLDWRHHRTRQAVYKDLRRAAAAFRVRERVSPHSMRKVYAVRYYNSTRHEKDLAALRKVLNHSDEAVTLIYAIADQLTRQHNRRCKRS